MGRQRALDGRTVKGTLHLGLRRRRRLPPRCGSTIGCSPSTIREQPRAQLSRRAQPRIAGHYRKNAKLEPHLKVPRQAAGSRWQFERLGYFYVDPDGGFNRASRDAQRDSWAKIEKKQQSQPAPVKKRQGERAGEGGAARARRDWHRRLPEASACAWASCARRRWWRSAKKH